MVKAMKILSVTRRPLVYILGLVIMTSLRRAPRPRPFKKLKQKPNFIFITVWKRGDAKIAIWKLYPSFMMVTSCSAGPMLGPDKKQKPSSIAKRSGPLVPLSGVFRSVRKRPTLRPENTKWMLSFWMRSVNRWTYIPALKADTSSPRMMYTLTR